MKSFCLWVLLFLLCFPSPFFARDLKEVQQAGVLRHLGIPYANFVKTEGNELTGLSVDLMHLFADHLGVRYEFVESDWDNIIQELIGQGFTVLSNGGVQLLNKPNEIKGDIICTGFTVLPWRGKIVAYSQPTFPTQVWAIAKRKGPKEPQVAFHTPAEFKATIANFTILGKANTCLDPKLYGLSRQAEYFSGPVNDLAEAVLEGQADFGLLDCPDTLVALRKWPKELKVIGPVSEVQSMAAGFRPESESLRVAFDAFLLNLKQNGTYYRLVKKHYPDIFFYFPEAFREIKRPEP